MAWPPRRRSTRQTHRERTNALLTRGVFIITVLVGAGLLILSRYAPDRTEGLRSASADVAAPVWSVLQTPTQWVSNLGRNIGAYWDSADRVKQLEGRELLYQRRRVEFEEAVRENRELRAMMGVVDPSRAMVGTFAISGASSGAAASEALIGGGRRHGVMPGQPVRVPRGLIGRTIDTGRNAARVLLVTDADSRVPVRVVRTGLPALVMGTNAPLLDVDLSGPTSNQVEIGDRLITSGDGGLFSPGILVGTIVEIGGSLPLARPAALPALGQLVLVEEPWATNFKPLPDQEMPVGALPSTDAPQP